MDPAAPLSVGFLLGLRHSLDADHVAAVTTFVSREPRLSRCARAGLVWALGHSASLFAMGGLLLGLKLMLPPALERYLELGVGLMLVALGVDLFRKLGGFPTFHAHAHAHGGMEHAHAHLHEPGEEHPHGHDAHDDALSDRRPFLVGVVHGLAGSASVILLLVPAVGSVRLGLLALALFSLGMMAGMGMMAVALGASLRLALANSRVLGRRIAYAAGAFSILLGLFLIGETVLSPRS